MYRILDGEEWGKKEGNEMREDQNLWIMKARGMEGYFVWRHA
jgi:hypothetical protein